MASPLALRTPTCLACLRRITQPARPAILTQLRGKKTKSKLIVQLNDDIPGWGPKGNIMRVSREMMRVKFYPSGQMRYITPDEWRTGHYAENDISARNRHFLMRQEYESLEKEQDLYDPLAEDMARLEALRLEAPSQEQEQHHHHQVEVEQLEPERALELLNEFIPATLTFERRLVHAEGVIKFVLEPVAVEKPVVAKEPVVAEEPAAEELAAVEDAVAAAVEQEAAAAAPTAPPPEQQEKRQQQPILSGLAARRAKVLAQEQQKHEEAIAAKAAAKKPVPEKNQQQQPTPPQSQQQKDSATATTTADKAVSGEPRQKQQAPDLSKIHGSVSTFHIAAKIKEMMVLDPEAARIQIGGEDVTFVHEGAEINNTTKVENIGSYEVRITPHVGKTKMDSILRTIEVVPTLDDEAAAAAAAAKSSAE